MQFLEVKGIGLQEGDQVVLQPISFTQNQFQKIAIAGETGSGKSTLLQVIAGLVQPDSGQIYFEGKKVIGPQDKLIPGHPGIAYLSQQYELPQFLRVEQVLEYANTLTARAAKKLFKVCQIDHLVKRQTSQLSGGERQRIALAKLLLGAPKLLLLDEPYSNLDRVHRNTLKQVLKEVGEKLEITQILISHDPHDTLSWADEIMVLRNGKLTQKASPVQIYQQPKSEYVASLFGSYNLLTLQQADKIGLPNNNVKPGKKLLIRPEKIKVTTSKNSVVGEVKSVLFFGNYYQVVLNVNSIDLLVKADDNSVKIGDQVPIEIEADAIWYL